MRPEQVGHPWVSAPKGAEKASGAIAKAMQDMRFKVGQEGVESVVGGLTTTSRSIVLAYNLPQSRKL
jgi:hypothetical protein